MLYISHNITKEARLLCTMPDIGEMEETSSNNSEEFDYDELSNI
jgi:hypothetical protein